MVIPKGTQMAIFLKPETKKTPNKTEENLSWKDSVIKYIDGKRPSYESLVPSPKQMATSGISKEVSEITYQIPNSKIEPITCNEIIY